MKYYFNSLHYFLCSLLVVLISALPVFAQSADEMNYLSMYFTEDELKVVTATRSVQAISRVAENMSVITAKDIRLMNAHTVTEVLNTVTGIGIDFQGANLGGTSWMGIQGSDAIHVTVLVDGVGVNNLSSGFPEFIQRMPVQIIERIEIIKGPASSIWGSALGGVINIITKAGGGAKDLNGTLSASYGERGTADYRAEVFGAKERFEYYVYAGNFRTDGLRPGFESDRPGMFSKLAYNVSPDTKIIGSIYYERSGKNGEGYDIFPDPTTYYSDRDKHLLANLALHTALSPQVRLDMSVYTLQQTTETFTASIPDMTRSSYGVALGQSAGGDARITLTSGMHTLVVGSDYGKGILKAASLLDGRQGITKWDFFVNDTIAWDRLSITPGLRFDHSDDFGSFVSPSLGATYRVADNALLRATASRGFNNPNLFARFGTNSLFTANPDLRVEEVTSYQAGIETTALPHLWLKVSLFRNDVSKALEYAPGIGAAPSTFINNARVRHQGAEAEVKTAPVFHTYFFGGVTYVDSKDLVTDTTQKGNPGYLINAGLKYENKKVLMAVLQGHYIWWNATSYENGQYTSMIFDASLTRTIFNRNNQSCDIFFTAHNIFDGSQYLESYWQNPRRWFEAGVRYKF